MKQITNRAISSTPGVGLLIRHCVALAQLGLIAIIFALSQFAITPVSASVADGDKAMRAEAYRAAITQYEAYLKDNPNDGAVIFKAAQAYEGAKWWGRAVQLWERYIALFPGDPQADNAKKHAADCHRWIGANYYITGGSYRSAVEHLNIALELDPLLADAYVWLATIYRNEGLYDETVAILEKGLAIMEEDEILVMMHKDAENYRDTGGHAYVAHRKGIALYESGDTAGSLDMFRVAAEATPDFEAAHLWIARILFEQGHFADSIPEWRAAIRIRADNEQALFYLQLAQSNVAAGK